MKRRNFLKHSTAGLAGASLLGAPTSLQAMFMKNPYVAQIGLQLYTVREQLEADFGGTLAAIKKAGYWQVEAADVGQLAKLAPLTKDLDLQVKCSFLNWNYVLKNFEATGKTGSPSQDFNFSQLLETAKQHNLEYLVFGYLVRDDRQTLDQYRVLIEKLNKAGELCKQAGIKLCYHNHSFEFEPIDGIVPFELLLDGLDPEYVRFELDVFWASLGGYDPVKLLNRMKGKVRLLHLKDKEAGTPVIFDESKVPLSAYKELGQGELPLKKIMKAGEKAGVEYCMVEQDASPDPLASIAMSYQWLQQV